MGYVIIFMMSWAIIEFIIMIASYDDYGENFGSSFMLAVIVLAIIVGVNYTSDAEEDGIELTEQVQHKQGEELSEQLTKDIIDVFDEANNKPSPPTDTSIVIGNSVEHTQVITPDLVIPSTVSHLDQSRRNHDTTVQYIEDTKRACIGDNCFRAKLFQHTDGTFWACKRNYGVCYHYEMRFK